MFGRAVNPYDEIVAKATDEKQTEINWEIALTVWDKVNEDGESGARNCIAALQKRLTHRSANVQLFSLTLAGALVSNCGPPLHREISGKAFTSSLTRLINDRTTHDTVKKEALKQIESWVKEHPGNGDFDLLVETYEQLKRQGHKFGDERPPTPKGPADDLLRREEEELQRALAESAALADPLRNFQRSGSGPDPSASPTASKSLPAHPQSSLPTHVRGLFDFEGETSDELAFKRGEVVKVLEKVSEEWWRGELKGRVGIFPTNYVEEISASAVRASQTPSSATAAQPTPSAGADVEAEIFAQAAAVDRLLALMHTLRARGEDFADNDELTDLYNSSMALRPKVVQLIRKYEQKQAELHAMHDKVNRAKATYEQLAGRQPTQQHQPRQYPPQHIQPNGYPQAGPRQQACAAPAQQPSTAQPGDPHARSAYPPASQGPPPGAAEQLSAEEEEQRREYEQKWAEYERQMEEYNRAMAILQQAQPGGVAPLPQNAHSQQPHPQPQPQQQSHTDQDQPQPVWDAQAGQWVWPQLQAHVAAPPPPFGQDGQAYPPQSPGPPGHASSHPAPVQQHPLPHQLHEQMANLSVAAGSPPPQPGYPAQQPPYGAPPQQATSPPPPAAAAQHAAPPQHYAQLPTVISPSLATAQSPAPYQQQVYPADPYGQQQQHGQAQHDPAWAAWHTQQQPPPQGMVPPQ
ncbi:class E vacuolar protein-sorting machinery protein hse1 [Rhodotorula toruloides]|uniref:Class E vacuolar protein-sorting machinery protein HSE1 n=1 Tax=Rhodotorula toruloides TaxID=5286 RepID=A0A511KF72_RHOTO|nr:class E vacuolar protein-sorting machinery protein hse1 [Rhodotorula toruloides]